MQELYVDSLDILRRRKGGEMGKWGQASYSDKVPVHFGKWWEMGSGFLFLGNGVRLLILTRSRFILTHFSWFSQTYQTSLPNRIGFSRAFHLASGEADRTEKARIG